MEWTKAGEFHGRIYTAKGARGQYRIDLEMPVDRWVIWLNDERLCENVYYVTNAKRIAQGYDITGLPELPDALRVRPDSGAARFVAKN